MNDISIFEVALRNSYSQCLAVGFIKGHWLLDDSSPLRRPIHRTNSKGHLRDVNSINRKIINEVVARKGRDTDAIISGLSLGFWTHMTDKNHERDVWIPYLHSVWPSGTNRADLHKAITSINGMRNRVAHHERLFNPSKQDLAPRGVGEEIVKLMFMLDLEIATNIYGDPGASKTNEFLAGNPCPADVCF